MAVNFEQRLSDTRQKLSDRFEDAISQLQGQTTDKLNGFKNQLYAIESNQHRASQSSPRTGEYPKVESSRVLDDVRQKIR